MKTLKLLGFAAALLAGAAVSAKAQQLPAPNLAQSQAANQDEAGPAGGKRQRGGLRGACRADMAQFCNQASGERGGRRQCLEANLTKLSANCQAALNQQHEQQARLRQACRGDMQSLCSDVAAGGGAKLQCLRQKISQVTPDCATALASPSGGRHGRRSGDRIIAPKT